MPNSHIRQESAVVMTLNQDEVNILGLAERGDIAGALKQFHAAVDMGTAIDISAADGNGRTLLHYAAQQSDLAHLKQIVHLGAKVDLQDQSGKTPLEIALDSGHKASAALLIESGTNLKLLPDKLEGAMEMSRADDIAGFLISQRKPETPAPARPAPKLRL